MVDNWFTAYPTNVHDLIVTPKTRDVKVWLDKEDVGLELSFKRISMKELEAMLEADRKRSRVVAEELERKLQEQMPLEEREWRRNTTAEIWKRDNLQKEDLIAAMVTQWVMENCQMDDGLIPILNFEQMAIHFHGHRLVIKDGMADSLLYCLRLNSGGSYNLKCPCLKCVDIPMTF